MWKGNIKTLRLEILVFLDWKKKNPKKEAVRSRWSRIFWIWFKLTSSLPVLALRDHIYKRVKMCFLGKDSVSIPFVNQDVTQTNLTNSNHMFLLLNYRQKCRVRIWGGTGIGRDSMENAILPMQKWKTVSKFVFLHLYAPGPKQL